MTRIKLRDTLDATVAGLCYVFCISAVIGLIVFVWVGIIHLLMEGIK